MNNKRTLFDFIRFIIPYIYAVGIILIVSWMITCMVILAYAVLATDPMQFFFQGGQPASAGKDPWFDYVIKPLITPAFHQILFRGSFLLLVWMMLFLIIPVAFKRLRRFKFFSMEIEVEETERTAIETIELTGKKAKLMAYLSGEDAAAKTIQFCEQTGEISYPAILGQFLHEINELFKEAFGSAFSHSVYKTSIPEKYQELAEESEEQGYCAIRNKEDNDNPFHHNVLVYTSIREGSLYFTVLTSYTHQFDIMDRYLFQLLHHSVAKNTELVAYVEAAAGQSEH